LGSKRIAPLDLAPRPVVQEAVRCLSIGTAPGWTDRAILNRFERSGAAPEVMSVACRWFLVSTSGPLTIGGIVCNAQPESL
jgi:hypothetical protein